MNGIYYLNGLQPSWYTIVSAINGILAAVWILSGVLIIIFFKYADRFKALFNGISGSIRNAVSNTYYKLLEGSFVSVFGYSYDRKQDIFYSNVDCWQRKYGYCRLYDESAILSGMVCDCEPVYFQYDNKKWLIEFWKGQYIFATGCEIGIYNTSRPDIEIPNLFNGTFFDSVKNEEMLNMSCKLYKNGALLFEREGVHWWLTGFMAGEFSNPSELEVDINITLKDEQMLSAFLEGLKRTGYSEEEIKTDGLTVSILFSKPYSKQPYSRTREIEGRTQWENKYLCDLYNSITIKTLNTPRKIYGLRRQDKDVFQHIKDMGKPKKLFDIYHKIGPYLSD